MPSFIKRHYLNDAKLAQRALLEFHRALSSGRLIVFTGSLTTEPCGYGRWSDLVDAYGRLANVAQTASDPGAAWSLMNAELDAIVAGCDDEPRALDPKVESFRRYLRDHQHDNFDLRVALGLFEEVLLGSEADESIMPQHCGDWELDTARAPIDLLSISIAQYFRQPRTQPVDASTDILTELIRTIGARRIATVNYDFELEKRLMLADMPSDGKETPFDQLRRLRSASANEQFNWQLSSGRIRRVMPSGEAIESDILNRDRIDRLLEFAIGGDDVDQHILHLHGRACDHNSMILSYRDYDRLYRRSGLSKLPFEFAQRILMGGNPILFVGLGMSEAELNQALQDFVSGSPYQRVAPTFLLWNTDPEDQEGRDGSASRMEMQRLDWLHRLGVFTIFDVDLPGYNKALPPNASVPTRLVRLIQALPHHASRIAERETLTEGTEWRFMSKAVKRDGLVVVWKLTEASCALSPAWTKLRDSALGGLTTRLQDDRSSVTGIIAKQGCGKGSLAFQLASSARSLGVDQSNVMLINCSFSFDTDSVLDAITRFLYARTSKGRPDEGERRHLGTSRSGFFRSLVQQRDGDPLLLVLNGCERFFSVRGELLSAELHELLWLCAHGRLPRLRLVLIGTARVRDYIVSELGSPVIEAHELGLQPQWNEEGLPIHRLDAIREAFAGKGIDVATLAPGRKRMLEDATARLRASSATRISGDLAELRQRFFEVYLDPQVLSQALGAERMCLAMEILRALAFIGLPVEAQVLFYVPRIRRLTSEKGIAIPSRLDEVTKLLVELTELGLVLELVGHTRRAGEPSLRDADRYTLPRLLLSELRARFSVPLSEAKLSTAFNMSLYVAQPVDGYIPEPEIHNELGHMVDQLLGAYRDMARDKPKLEHVNEVTLQNISAELMPHEHRSYHTSRTSPPQSGAKPQDKPRNLARELETLASPENIQCLRAALSLVRGYYTTTDLLTLDVGDRLVREGRNGVLLEHAERLDGLIDAYGKVALARAKLRNTIGPRFTAAFGSIEPLYPDELVWLHNERGVIRLAMGDLYEARSSLLRALEINTQYVEFSDRSHNWRRIRLNQLTVDLEGGEISLALRKIEEILAVSRSSPTSGGEVDCLLTAIDSREDRLAIAVATGYRGWARHLQGEWASASTDYATAIKTLSELGEARAQIYFRRLRITLLASEPSAEERARELNATMDLALATRQMDLVYRLRVIREAGVLDNPNSDNHDRKMARRTLEDAHRYSLQTDVHRVRVEADMGLAHALFQLGDYEGALRAVSDAMMVATRFGLELRKIVLRSVMAMIMAERGHPITASSLAATAIRVASRLRYSQAIRHAERTLAKIPRVAGLEQALSASHNWQS